MENNLRALVTGDLIKIPNLKGFYTVIDIKANGLVLLESADHAS